MILLEKNYPRYLKLNVEKIKCLIFGKDTLHNDEIIIDNTKFEIVNSFKYLGNILNSKMDDSEDIELKLHNFYKSFYPVLNCFSNVEMSTFLFIFNAYCMPNYGLELWCSSGIFNKKVFKTFEVAYCKSLKRISNVPNYYSNHFVAEMCNQFLFDHYVNLKQAKFLKSIDSCKLPLYSLNRIYFFNGIFYQSIFKNFIKKYNVNVFKYDFKILKSRLQFVQLHEK